MIQLVQWEYHTEQVISPGHDKSTHDERMRQLGKEGWECCGVGDRNAESTTYRMFFKRPILPPNLSEK